MKEIGKPFLIWCVLIMITMIACLSFTSEERIPTFKPSIPKSTYHSMFYDEAEMERKIKILIQEGYIVQTPSISIAYPSNYVWEAYLVAYKY